jgi:hypothetical protein
MRRNHPAEEIKTAAGKRLKQAKRNGGGIGGSDSAKKGVNQAAKMKRWRSMAAKA